jgi:hypothetical protein
MPHRQFMSPRDGAAVADNRLVWTMRRSTSAAYSRGRVEEQTNWSFGGPHENTGDPIRCIDIDKVNDVRMYCTYFIAKTMEIYPWRLS